jgi:hypothetical protein
MAKSISSKLRVSVVTNKAEIAEITKERDWWRDLAAQFGCTLLGWSYLPPRGRATWILPDGKNTAEIPGPLAQAMHKRLSTPKSRVSAIWNFPRSQNSRLGLKASRRKRP